MRNFWLLLPLITLATGISTSVPAQAECNEGDIALTNVHEGRGIVSGGLKLCTRGKWVTICHSDWELEDAVVACRQLNLSTTEVGYCNESCYGNLHTTTSIFKFNCTGDEERLTNCHSRPRDSGCGEAAGVICGSTVASTSTGPTSTASGYSSSSGAERTAGTCSPVAPRGVSQSQVMGLGGAVALLSVALVGVVLGWTLTCWRFYKMISSRKIESPTNRNALHEFTNPNYTASETPTSLNPDLNHKPSVPGSTTSPETTRYKSIAIESTYNTTDNDQEACIYSVVNDTIDGKEEGGGGESKKCESFYRNDLYEFTNPNYISSETPTSLNPDFNHKPSVPGSTTSSETTPHKSTAIESTYNTTDNDQEACIYSVVDNTIDGKEEGGGGESKKCESFYHTLEKPEEEAEYAVIKYGEHVTYSTPS